MVRSFSNRILGGVCGGLASMTPLNAWIWRVLFIVLTVATVGVGAIAYLLLWWMLPLDSPIRRSYGGAVQSLFAIVFSLGIVIAWFMRGDLIPEGAYLPVVILTLAFVIFIKQITAGSQGNIPLGVVILLVPTVYLLGELDVLPLGVYDIATRSLPAVLIFFGLSVILRYRVPFGSWIALVISAILIFGVTTIAYNSRVDTKRSENQVAIDESISSDITTLQINLDTRDTDVIVQVSDMAQTILGEFLGSNNSTVSMTYEESGTIATFTLEEKIGADFPRLEDIGRGEILIQIPPEIAVAVAFEGESGAVTMDMASINLERLNLFVTDGDVVIILPEYNPLSPSARANPGTWTVVDGNLRVIVPENVGARFLLDRSINSEPRAGQNFDDLVYRVELGGDDYVLVTRQYDALLNQLEARINLYNGRLSVE